MIRYIFITLWMCLHFFPALARDNGKTVKCEGTFSYVFGETVALAKAKKLAEQYAVNDAMANHPDIGTIVSSVNVMETTNERQSFHQYASTWVKGKLVRHLKEPNISSPVFNGPSYTLSVTVSFEARILVTPAIEFSAKTLRNGTDDKHESTLFKHDDRMYMSFKTPRQGYLAIFYDDADTVRCAMPELGNDSAPVLIEKDKRYVFFDSEDEDYTMECNEEPEMLILHVIFCPESFIHSDLVRDATQSDFNKWLNKIRSFYPEMQYMPILLEITPGD